MRRSVSAGTMRVGHSHLLSPARPENDHGATLGPTGRWPPDFTEQASLSSESRVRKIDHMPGARL